MTVLVDTSALYAVLDRNDASHPAAKSILAGLAAADERLVTHSYVVVEAFALTQRRLGNEAVRRLALDLMPVVAVTWVGPALHERAVSALLAAPSSVSLVDRVSFELMREEGIDQAFAFDDDFEREGFRLLWSPIPATQDVQRDANVADRLAMTDVPAGGGDAGEERQPASRPRHRGCRRHAHHP